MNIDYIIYEDYVSHILFTKIPEYEITLNNKPFLLIYKIDNIILGVYYNNNFSCDIVNDLSHGLYEQQLNEINIINTKCKDMYMTFNKMKDYNIMEDVDIQHYDQKFNDRLQEQYDKFIEIIKSL